ncbi:MAG: DUF1343 domain-containing protein [Bacteroidales bacterium]|nr:DUF1343 domain-containing protein [Bacteroidales bacterium]
MIRNTIVVLALAIITLSCRAEPAALRTGAERTEAYVGLLRGKSVAIAGNQTTTVGTTHLVDTLLRLGVDVKVIFAPEHGFREMAAAGASITGGVDEATGVRVVSLYGNRFKPQPADLEGIDVVVFDIQDVGARFYTYISTMHYVMEACAENGIKCIILDRPNPNGFYTDGPVREPEFKSFVGMHPVPVVHGMTIGEYAMMVNGEGWLEGGIRCDLEVIMCENYTHGTYYELPVRPSPNLPNQTSVYLYPSLCFFEGTNISVGRGTPFPFQVFGAPSLEGRYAFSFMPESLPEAGTPMHLGKKCYGADLRDAMASALVPSPKLDLSWLIEAWNAFPDKDNFFRSYFETIAGTRKLREQIEAGMTAGQIRESWSEGLKDFEEVRRKYLLYPL